MGNVFEAKVGDGRLLFSSIDLAGDLENRHTAKQLRRSLTDYMNGEKFRPTIELSIGDIQNLKQ